MDISILISTYKRIAELKKTLASFERLDSKDLKWEVLIADNADDLETQKVIKYYSQRLPINFIVEKIRGKNNALNSLLRIAKGDLFVFTDDDIIADKNWLMEVWAGTKRWPEADIFGGKTLPKWPNDVPPNFLNIKNLGGIYGITYCEKEEGPFLPKWAFGANVAIRKRVFDAGWKYNPSIGPSGDQYICGSETEFLKRLDTAGYKGIYLPNAIVFHQIRSEQMEIDWVYKRAFKLGRGQMYYEKNSGIPILFNAPRYLVRRIIKVLILRCTAFFTFNISKRINLGMEYWFIKGQIFQFKAQNQN